MNSKSLLSTKDLELLKSKLPHGSINKIGELTGFDKSTVSKVLKGDFHNEEVILAAIKLAREGQSKIENLSSMIKAL